VGGFALSTKAPGALTNDQGHVGRTLGTAGSNPSKISAASSSHKRARLRESESSPLSSEFRCLVQGKSVRLPTPLTGVTVPASPQGCCGGGVSQPCGVPACGRDRPRLRSKNAVTRAPQRVSLGVCIVNGVSRHDRRRAKRKRHHTPLQGHSRSRKKLVTPFNQLPNLRPTNWVADQLPELLFAAAMLDAYDGSYEPVWAFLEVLDRFVDEPKLVDGHMTSFQRVPSEQRNEARAALAAPGIPPLPDEWNHALALYPDGPAAWLVSSESESPPSDPAVAIPYLQRLVRGNFDSRSVPATRLRLVPIGRLVKAGRIRVPPGFLEMSYIPRYPGGLTDDEQRAAESEIRAMYGALQAADRAPSYFSRQNFRISVCEEARAPASSSHPEAGSEPSETDIQPPTPAEFRDRLVAAGAALSEALRDRQKRVELDLYAPEVDEVKLGMASRQVRLLRLLLSDLHLWNGATGAHVLRSLVDELITCLTTISRISPTRPSPTAIGSACAARTLSLALIRFTAITASAGSMALLPHSTSR
jgi:hypothetical protein